MIADERLDLLLHRFLSGFFSIPARQRTTGNISISQMRVLWILERRKSATPSDVAADSGVSCSTITELADRLENTGLVRRTHSDEDRRQVFLGLTAKGRRLVAEFARHRLSRVRKIVSILGVQDVHRMAEALETLNEIATKWQDT